MGGRRGRRFGNSTGEMKLLRVEVQSSVSRSQRQDAEVDLFLSF